MAKIFYTPLDPKIMKNYYRDTEGDMENTLTHLQLKLPKDIKQRLREVGQSLGFPTINSFASVVLHWAALQPGLTLMDFAITRVLTEDEIAEATGEVNRKKVAEKAT